MHPKEKELQQRRTILAASNNLIGPSGKLGVIARHLGHMIIDQDGGGLFDTRYIETQPVDPSTDVNQTLPTIEGGSGSYEDSVKGVAFDGLSRGMHIEIKYLKETAELTVYYKGYEVYREVGGDLHCYAPFPEWETMVEKLYQLAKKKQKDYQDQMVEIQAIEDKSDKASFLEQLRRRWGI